MITGDEVMPLLLKACPSFRKVWEKRQAEEAQELAFRAETALLLDPADRKRMEEEIAEDTERLASELCDKEQLYIHLGDFARHLVDLLKQRETAEFPAVFALLEKLYDSGDDFVQNAATVGLLEGIQNAALGEADVDPELFKKWLLPVSAEWWDEVNRIWATEVKFE